MSLILDALNKADDERTKSHLPSLNSSHGSNEDEDASKHQQKVLIGLSSAVILLFGVVIFLLFNKDEASPPTSSTSTHRVNTETSPAPVKAFDAPRKPGGNPTDSTDNRDVENSVGPGPKITAQSKQSDETYQRMKEKQIAAQYHNAQNKNSQTNSQTKVQSSVNNTKVSQIYQQSAKPTVNPIPKTEIKATEKPAPKIIIKTLDDYPTLSFIGELAYSVQKKIPTVMYTEHAFSLTGDGFVRLNNTKRKKGQQVAENLTLEEILEDGVVLKHGNLRFKMSALNSWVNI